MSVLWQDMLYSTSNHLFVKTFSLGDDDDDDGEDDEWMGVDELHELWQGIWLSIEMQATISCNDGLL